MAAVFKSCLIDGCNRNAATCAQGARGWCRKHYSRWRRHGNPHLGSTAHGEPLKFLHHVVNNPPQHCVLWPFGHNGLGYGVIYYCGRRYGAHRLAWEIFHGRSMSRDADACHEPLVCHNPSCINPLHIREDSRRANSHDALIDGTRPCGEKSGSAKLSLQEVQEIRSLAICSSQTDLAKAFGVSGSTVSRILSGKLWVA